MKVLFDTNVVLDVLLAREPHVETAARLMSHVDQGDLKGLLCATTVTTIHYLAVKAADRRRAGKYVRELMAIFEIAPVSRDILIQAMDLDFADYEDAVLHEAGRAAGATCIVTRNRKDFSGARLPVYDPKELLSALLHKKQQK
jgi:predicted nucleic acid-binding protein